MSKTTKSLLKLATFLIKLILENTVLKRLVFFVSEKKSLTGSLKDVTIINGTFYFWSLKSVQRRADNCCKSTHR